MIARLPITIRGNEHVCNPRNPRSGNIDEITMKAPLVAPFEIQRRHRFHSETLVSEFVISREQIELMIQLRVDRIELATRIANPDVQVKVTHDECRPFGNERPMHIESCHYIFKVCWCRLCPDDEHVEVANW